MYNGKITRSNDIKDVIHIRVKKFAGYFNPESRHFAVDPHLTTFEDLQKILIEAFNLTGPFHITYLCRDDAGENVFLSMLTEWDLDAAFMTSSDPYLRLKLDAEPYKDGLMSKMKDWETHDSPAGFFQNNSRFVKTILQPVTNSVNSVLFQNVQKSWINSLGGAFNKLTGAWGYSGNHGDIEDYFPAKPPLDDAEFRTFLGENGKLTKPEGLRLRVYNGGVTSALRKVVWRLLLNVFPQHLTGEERIDYIKRKSDEYVNLRRKWQSQADCIKVKQISNMVWKDALRTDRSHPFYSGDDDNANTHALMNILTTYALTHPGISYCQGMSDLASPLLLVMNNEAQAYVCFCGLMMRLRDNFSRHGKAISLKFKHLAMLVKHHDPMFFKYLQSLGADNMFFCYRWILLEMKREFSFGDSITVLEVMWSSLPPHPPSEDLPLEDYATVESPSALEDCGLIESVSSLNKNEGRTQLTEDVRTSVMKETASSSTLYSSYDALSECDKAPFPVSEPPASFPGRLDADTEKEGKENADTDSLDDEFYADEDGVSFHDPRIQKKSSQSHLSNISSPSPEEDPHKDRLPPPEELGYGNPFLLFVCLAVLLQERDTLMLEKMEYDDMVMHFDKMARRHFPKKILSRAMKLFAEYLRGDIAFSSST